MNHDYFWKVIRCFRLCRLFVRPFSLCVLRSRSPLHSIPVFLFSRFFPLIFRFFPVLPLPFPSFSSGFLVLPFSSFCVRRNKGKKKGEEKKRNTKREENKGKKKTEDEKG